MLLGLPAQADAHQRACALAELGILSRTRAARDAEALGRDRRRLSLAQLGGVGLTLGNRRRFGSALRGGPAPSVCDSVHGHGGASVLDPDDRLAVASSGRRTAPDASTGLASDALLPRAAVDQEASLGGWLE